MSTPMKTLRRILWLLRPDTEIQRHCLSLGVKNSYPVHGWLASSWPNRESQSGFNGVSENRKTSIDRCIAQEDAARKQEGKTP